MITYPPEMLPKADPDDDVEIIVHDSPTGCAFCDLGIAVTLGYHVMKDREFKCPNADRLTPLMR